MDIFIASLVYLAVGSLIGIFVIACGVRLGMKWARRDERDERAGQAPYRAGESVFDHKPQKRFKPPKNLG